jgi:hypothetical protein
MKKKYDNNICVFGIQGLFHLPYNILSNVFQADEISSHFYIKMFGFSLILNGARSNDGLNRRPKLVTVVIY